MRLRLLLRIILIDIASVIKFLDPSYCRNVFPPSMPFLYPLLVHPEVFLAVRAGEQAGFVTLLLQEELAFEMSLSRGPSRDIQGGIFHDLAGMEQGK